MSEEERHENRDDEDDDDNDMGSFLEGFDIVDNLEPSDEESTETKVTDVEKITDVQSKENSDETTANAEAPISSPITEEPTAEKAAETEETTPNQDFKTSSTVKTTTPLKTIPTDKKSTPTSVETPATLKATPTPVKSAAANVKLAPANVKAAPATVKSAPADVKATPADVKSVPANVKTTPIKLVKPKTVVRKVAVTTKTTPVSMKPTQAPAKTTPTLVRKTPSKTTPTTSTEKTTPSTVKTTPVAVGKILTATTTPSELKTTSLAVKTTPSVDETTSSTLETSATSSDSSKNEVKEHDESEDTAKLEKSSKLSDSSKNESDEQSSTPRTKPRPLSKKKNLSQSSLESTDSSTSKSSSLDTASVSSKKHNFESSLLLKEAFVKIVPLPQNVTSIIVTPNHPLLKPVKRRISKEYDEDQGLTTAKRTMLMEDNTEELDQTPVLKKIASSQNSVTSKSEVKSLTTPVKSNKKVATIEAVSKSAATMQKTTSTHLPSTATKVTVVKKMSAPKSTKVSSSPTEVNIPGPQAKAAVPKTKAAAPQTKAAVPQTKAAVPQIKAPDPQTKAPGPPTKAPGPQTKALGPQTKAAGPQTKAPGPQTKVPGHQTKAPAPQTKEPAIIQKPKIITTATQPKTTTVSKQVLGGAVSVVRTSTGKLIVKRKIIPRSTQETMTESIPTRTLTTQTPGGKNAGLAVEDPDIIQKRIAEKQGRQTVNRLKTVMLHPLIPKDMADPILKPYFEKCHCLSARFMESNRKDKDKKGHLEVRFYSEADANKYVVEMQGLKLATGKYVSAKILGQCGPWDGTLDDYQKMKQAEYEGVNNARCVYVHNIPPGTDQTMMKLLYPEAVAITIQLPKEDDTLSMGHALLEFSDAEEAETVAKESKKYQTIIGENILSLFFIGKKVLKTEVEIPTSEKKIEKVLVETMMKSLAAESKETSELRKATKNIHSSIEFLEQWAKSVNKTVNYRVSDKQKTGTWNCNCTCFVAGYSYIGHGWGTQKMARRDAAYDYITKLVGENIIDKSFLEGLENPPKMLEKAPTPEDSKLSKPKVSEPQRILSPAEGQKHLSRGEERNNRKENKPRDRRSENQTSGRRNSNEITRLGRREKDATEERQEKYATLKRQEKEAAEGKREKEAEGRREKEAEGRREKEAEGRREKEAAERRREKEAADRKRENEVRDRRREIEARYRSLENEVTDRMRENEVTDIRRDSEERKSRESERQRQSAARQSYKQSPERTSIYSPNRESLTKGVNPQSTTISALKDEITRQLAELEEGRIIDPNRLSLLAKDFQTSSARKRPGSEVKVEVGIKSMKLESERGVKIPGYDPLEVQPVSSQSIDFTSDSPYFIPPFPDNQLAAQQTSGLALKYDVRHQSNKQVDWSLDLPLDLPSAETEKRLWSRMEPIRELGTNIPDFKHQSNEEVDWTLDLPLDPPSADTEKRLWSRMEPIRELGTNIPFSHPGSAAFNPSYRRDFPITTLGSNQQVEMPEKSFYPDEHSTSIDRMGTYRQSLTQNPPMVMPATPRYQEQPMVMPETPRYQEQPMVMPETPRYQEQPMVMPETPRYQEQPMVMPETPRYQEQPMVMPETPRYQEQPMVMPETPRYQEKPMGDFSRGDSNQNRSTTTNLAPAPVGLVNPEILKQQLIKNLRRFQEGELSDDSKILTQLAKQLLQIQQQEGGKQPDPLQGQHHTSAQHTWTTSSKTEKEMTNKEKEEMSKSSTENPIHTAIRNKLLMRLQTEGLNSGTISRLVNRLQEVQQRTTKKDILTKQRVTIFQKKKQEETQKQIKQKIIQIKLNQRALKIATTKNEGKLELPTEKPDWRLTTMGHRKGAVGLSKLQSGGEELFTSSNQSQSRASNRSQSRGFSQSKTRRTFSQFKAPLPLSQLRSSRSRTKSTPSTSETSMGTPGRDAIPALIQYPHLEYKTKGILKKNKNQTESFQAPEPEYPASPVPDSESHSPPKPTYPESPWNLVNYSPSP